MPGRVMDLMDADKASAATGMSSGIEGVTDDQGFPVSDPVSSTVSSPVSDPGPTAPTPPPLVACLDEFDPPFSVAHPRVQVAPFVLSSPHSGRNYPRAFLEVSALDAVSLRRSEDSFVDEIFADAPRLGVPLLSAEFPRAFLDVNREAYELDPAMFEGQLPRFVNTRSHRVASGLGTIARVVCDGRDIYRRKLLLADVMERIDRLHHPYHKTLGALLDTTRARFGAACLIDCHSMPSSRASGNYGGNYGGRHRQRADIVLGNRHGTSCSPVIIEEAERVLKSCGYKVARNEPFAGGYCTEHFGRPMAGYHALQIEIGRELYMNEATLERTEGLTTLRRDMALLVESFIGLEAECLKSPLQSSSPNTR